MTDIKMALKLSLFPQDGVERKILCQQCGMTCQKQQQQQHFDRVVGLQADADIHAKL